MIIDCHCHIFTERIVRNVRKRPEMLRRLALNTEDALQRLAPANLVESAEANNIALCVLLPSALPDSVVSENDLFLEMASQSPRLRSLATLHPTMRDISSEIMRMFDRDVRGFKLSSFSQRFDPTSPESDFMFGELERLGLSTDVKPVVLLDTFAKADLYFDANPDHLTTPAKLAEIARRHQGLNIIGAHMGGLLADFSESRDYLVPGGNLFLDTANAAHTLSEDQFVELLEIHGPSHILFGTDWPWFFHESELKLIERLSQKAGYTEEDCEQVLGHNARNLLGL